ncbi:FAD-binding oxidoreductase [Actinomadura barringtoniae]|uniref:Delta(24)-sterol reductase n=1 Tax=Actinomadura barringtoniae TaxID=1427535 RepID=A0A939PMR3_9ACTN|nr:FAD-binding oxidoreductase [Actinomadura barringtoniae]MBO2455817.1 FAD-binding oxidoreductase [Actinomadura barringtoniae]
MTELLVKGDHQRAVEALRRSYEAIPQGTPVRLAKKTSNLFRWRDPSEAPGLDVSGFDKVLSVDPETRTAQVQGMTTYEDLVDATLPHGLMPSVVPQLKTITLGGAVTGLGIESTSFRLGLPHEAVLEMEVLTGDGQIVTATPDNEHKDLFFGFPNSYGTLGYSLRLKIQLIEVKPYVRVRHLRFDDAGECARTLAEITERGTYDGETVDFMDGTVFSGNEQYITLGFFTDEAPYTSDYTGQEIYYKSIQRRSVDFLTVRDYIWRWDTDWFWCSGAFGVQNPTVRRLWPDKAKRSDVYRKMVAYDRRFQIIARVERWRGLRPREDVIQDIEVPVERLPEFLEFFHDKVGMSPIWLCPLRAKENWPLYPLEPGRTYVNVGFWGTVRIPMGQIPEYHNRLIERKVAALDGHKSLYSTSFYSREEFWRHYDGETYRRLKDAYDPAKRLLDLYDKCVGGR